MTGVGGSKPMLTAGRKLGGIYCLGRRLGNGSFGEIYFVVDTQTGEELAVKVESAHCKYPMLIFEAKLLRHLQGAPGFAKVHYADIDGDHNVMVMDLLGPSLEDLFNSRRRRFSLKTVLMLAEQMLHRIEYLHSRNFIHRDIKPDNFLVGNPKLHKADIVHLIDFGLAKQYRDPRSHKHIAYQEGKSLTGTARYASINAHIGLEQSRRDDLEAIGYVLMYFNRGKLPWQGIQANAKEEKYRKIMEVKIATPIETLCSGYPEVFSIYFKYCKALRFEDTPDYSYLRSLFANLFMQEGFADNGMFDWSQPSVWNSEAQNSGGRSSQRVSGEIDIGVREADAAQAVHSRGVQHLQSPERAHGTGHHDREDGRSSGPPDKFHRPPHEKKSLVPSLITTDGGSPTNAGRRSHGLQTLASNPPPSPVKREKTREAAAEKPATVVENGERKKKRGGFSLFGCCSRGAAED